MSDEDRKYLRFLEKKRPSLEVFSKMVGVLRNIQERTNKLLKETLSKTPRAI